MKVIAYIIALLFLGFLAIPSIVAIVDDNLNCSQVYTVNEEENKSEINFQFKLTQHQDSGFLINQFSLDKDQVFYDSRQAYHNIYIDVTFPPPKQL
ncbi:hypothetical protein INR75_03590 [Zunongwangia sp. SCSIO 43204]|uniref:hypothetical protein n=1 Tax=Zunongwangia sp. SCSIO 43204 TaxID=2779359 RepID=UPI001CA80F77|nr:hypothetical protein [Zunongwangia sp. SCSIO 43204]UAB85121.1 hypothetical protein INR75_03590 [Zunongwangia sp. SCSIO 43204]